MDIVFDLALAAFGLICCFRARALQRWAVRVSGISAFDGPVFLWWNRVGGMFVFAAAIYRLTYWDLH